jgi:hypothetical protein
MDSAWDSTCSRGGWWVGWWVWVGGWTGWWQMCEPYGSRRRCIGGALGSANTSTQRIFTRQ